MSSSTISTVNKYLLSGEIVPTVPTLSLKEANVTFPDTYNGLVSYFAGLTGHNRRLVITMPAGQGNAWRQKSGHEIIVSSYLKVGGTDYMTYEMFDNDNGTTFYGASWTNDDNFYDSTNMGKFTQASYNASGVYIGGGTNALSINNFYTTVFTGGSGSASGEFIDWIFPYQVELNSISFLCRSNLAATAPKDIILLGSNNNGSTWIFINSLTFGTYTAGTWQQTTVSTSANYSRIRCITVTTRSSAVNIGGCKLNYDIYDV